MKISLPIQGTTFLVRSIEHDDATPFFNMIESNRPRLIEYFPGTSKGNISLAATKKYITKNIGLANARKHFCLPIIDISTNDFIGLIVLKNIDWAVPKGELAYMVSDQHSGKGIMTKALKTFCNYAFEELKLIRLFSMVAEDNVASIKLSERCGLVKEGLLRNEYRCGLGKLKNVYVLGKLVEEHENSNPTMVE